MRITAYDPQASLHLASGVPSGGGGGGSLGSVTDGTTTVDPVTGLDFTAGATVTDPGTGIAQIAVTAGLNAELNIQGGQDVINHLGSMGAAKTVDPALGNFFDGTLNANCAVTLAAPTGTGFCSLEGWIAEDGTGGWTISFAGSVTVVGTHDTTPGTTQMAIVQSRDGGTSWVWTWIGSSVTSVGLSMPAEFTVTGSPITGSGTLSVAKANESANTVYAGPATGAAAAPTFRALVAADIPAGVGVAWRPVMVADTDGTHWNVLVDGGGNAIMTY